MTEPEKQTKDAKNVNFLDTKEKDSEYSLAQSKAGLGELSPVLKDAYGNIIDGYHRIDENKTWFSVTVPQIDDPIKLELARLAVNYVRRHVGPTELAERLSFLIKTGLKPDEISEKTGISRSTIYRHTPQDLKDQKYVELAKQKLSVSRDTENFLLSPGKENEPVKPKTPKIVKPVNLKAKGFNCPCCGSPVSEDKYEWMRQKFAQYPALFTSKDKRSEAT